MVGDAALRVAAAQAGAGVDTFLGDAGGDLAALGAHQALWPAVGRGSDHVALAGAHAHSVLLLVLAIGAARVGITWVEVRFNGDSSGREVAFGDGVSLIAQQAGTDRLVAVGVAHSIDATNPWAGVHTLLVNTGTIHRAVVVDNTLGPTGKVGVSEVARYACTGPCSST